MPLSELNGIAPSGAVRPHLDGNISLSELKLHEFTENVAADSPAPGGGSVAGFTAAIGAALGLMAARLTQNRKKYESFAAHAAEVESRLETLRTEALGLMEQDCAAFKKVSAAFDMPKETEGERAKRGAAIQEGLKACTETPLRLMELCAEGLNLVESMLGRCNDTCVSDLAMSALSLKAALQGAWLNVSVNISWLKDSAFAGSCRDRGTALLAAAEIADRCYEEVLKSYE